MLSVLCTKNLLIDMIGRADNGARVTLRLGAGDGSQSVSHSLDEGEPNLGFLLPLTFSPRLGLHHVSVLKKWTSSMAVSAWAAQLPLCAHVAGFT